MSIEIYDVFGRIQKAEGKTQKAEIEILVDVSHLPAGIYFVKIYSESNQVAYKKLIINH
jgi:hypothetical protein